MPRAGCPPQLKRSGRKWSPPWMERSGVPRSSSRSIQLGDRCSQTSRGQVDQELLELFAYVHNRRRFVRGKRQGLAPIEILTGTELAQSWLESLLEVPTNSKQATLVLKRINNLQLTQESFSEALLAAAE